MCDMYPEPEVFSSDEAFWLHLALKWFRKGKKKIIYKFLFTISNYFRKAEIQFMIN